MVELAVEVYRDIIVEALPVAIVFELCNLAVITFLNSAFRGRIWSGRS